MIIEGWTQFAKFNEEQKELFLSILDELSAGFTGMTTTDKEYLAMRIENNQFLNENNEKALRTSTLILMLLKEVYLWKPDDSDIEKQLNKKTKELLEILNEAENKQK